MLFDYDIHSCSRCNEKLKQDVFKYSTDQFQIPLCEDCQDWYRGLRAKPSIQSRRLFLALKEKGLHVDLEYFDGHKRIDISSKESMTHIEVDGEQHYSNALQALSDLLRTMYSNRDGFLTLRIPNSLIENNFKDTTNIISRILFENKNRKLPVQKKHHQQMMEHLNKYNRNSMKY